MIFIFQQLNECMNEWINERKLYNIFDIHLLKNWFKKMYLFIYYYYYYFVYVIHTPLDIYRVIK